MSDQHEYDLVKGGSQPPDEPGEPRPIGVWVAGVLLLLAAGVAAYFVFAGRPSSQPEPQASEAGAVAPAPPADPLGPEPEPIVLPPLPETDPLVRQLVGALSSHPRVAAWLATEGLIRNFATVVTNITDGVTPAPHLAVFRPSSGFRVVERGEDLVIDPASFERYNALADAVASVDAAGAAQLYATLKPRIQESYGELGFPDRSFDVALERAIVLLLNTPVPREPVAVEPRGIGYGFADDRFENLSAAQKQLLRLGPRNVRIVQRSLRDIALALGIPATRLPPAQ